MSVIVINDNAHARTPMAAHQTLLILVGEMTAVIAPGDPITLIGGGIVIINCHDAGRVLKERNTIAEGT